jgi:cytochrome c553
MVGTRTAGINLVDQGVRSSYAAKNAFCHGRPAYGSLERIMEGAGRDRTDIAKADE